MTRRKPHPEPEKPERKPKPHDTVLHRIAVGVSSVVLSLDTLASADNIHWLQSNGSTPTLVIVFKGFAALLACIAFAASFRKPKVGP